MDPKIFETFREVTIGQYQNFKFLISDLREHGSLVSYPVERLLRGLDTSKHHETLNLVLFPDEINGLEKSCILGVVYQTALTKGLELCPVEAGLQMCLQYRYDIGKMDFVVASAPILDRSRNRLTLLEVRSDPAKSFVSVRLTTASFESWQNKGSKFLFLQRKRNR